MHSHALAPMTSQPCWEVGIACFSRLKLSVTSQEPLRNKWRGEDQIPARIPKLLLRLKPSEVKAESSLPSVISKSQVTLVL